MENKLTRPKYCNPNCWWEDCDVCQCFDCKDVNTCSCPCDDVIAPKGYDRKKEADHAGK